MELRPDPNRAFTLIELIVAMVIFSVVLLAASSVMVSHVQFLWIFRQEAMLKEDNAYIMEKLKKIVMNSEHVDITTPPLRLKTYNRNSVNTGTVELNNATLTYKIEPGGPTETISTNVGSLSFDDVQVPGNMTTVRLLKVALSTSDPKRAAVSKSSIITSIACRLTPNTFTVYNVNKGEYYSKIQDAIIDASPGNEIRCMGDVRALGGVFDGIFSENLSIQKSVVLKGGYNQDFTNQDIKNRATTIDGQRLNSVIYCYVESFIVTINGFIIQNGNPVSGDGGGISASILNGATLNVDNNTITGNSVTGSGDTHGGGISASVTSNSTLNVTNNTITGNSVTGSVYSCGGGIDTSANSSSTIIIANNTITGNSVTGPGETFAGGINANALSLSTLIISNNIITGNSVNGNGGEGKVRGGGIATYNYTRASATITNNTITENHVTNSAAGFNGTGGGIYVGTDVGSWTPSVILTTITNNIISDNTVSGSTAKGGGVDAFAYRNGAKIAITRNTIMNNTMTGTSMACSGAVHGKSANSANVTIANNVLRMNHAGAITDVHGCTLCLGAYASGTITVTNNTITGNTGTSTTWNKADGCGIIAWMNSSSNLTINYNTITGNIASGSQSSSSVIHGGQKDGAVYLITNSIVYGNSPDNIKQDMAYQPVTVTYSDSGDLTYKVPPPVPPSGNIRKAPVFVNAAAGDYHLTATGNEYIINGGTGGTQMGAYGGPGAGIIGFVMPTVDLSSPPGPPNVREDKIGTY